MANGHLNETLELFRQKKQKKLEEIRDLEYAIRQIELELGVEHIDISVAESIPSQADSVTAVLTQSPKRRGDVRGDEFFGLSQPEAARRYLKKVGQAVSVEEILAALKRGGCDVGGADPKKTLYISMVRDTRNFVKLPSGLMGLREFYGDRIIRAGEKVPKEKKSRNKQTARKNVKKQKKEPIADAKPME